MLRLQLAVVGRDALTSYGDVFVWPTVPRVGELVEAPDEREYRVVDVRHHIGTKDPIYLVVDPVEG